MTEENIFGLYDKAKAYTEQLTMPFDEFQRIARNRPYDGIDPAYPKTTDGTTASIIRKTPRRVIQQIPTGVVESDNDDDWLPIVAQFIYTNKILPYANEDYDLLQKSWSVVEKGLTYGGVATFAPFLDHNGYFCPDMTEVYWGDFFVQPGKKSFYACNYFFIRSWWQKADLESVIEKQSAIKDTPWDVESLKEVLNALVEKEEKAKQAFEKDRGAVSEGIELITGFQKGVGAKFFTFNPDKKLIVRTKTNRDPRGKPNVDFMYADTDGANPLGRGIVELVGGLQNLIDSDMQMYQYNRALMLAPPLVKYGNIANSQIKFAPNAVIDMGNDTNAKLDTLKVDTSAVINYPDLYGLQKSQLLNLVNSPDTSISADIGNPGFSKTDAGVKQQQATVSVDDNYVRKMFEAWFENWSETAINLYFAERSGVEELQLDEKTANKLRELISEGKLDPSVLSEDNKLLINYDEATPALKFRVDASTSKTKDDAQQLQAWQTFFQAVDAIPALSQLMAQFPEKVIEAYNSIVSSAGVEDPEKIKITKEEFDQKTQQAAQAQAAAQPPTVDATAQMQPPQGMPPSPEEEQIMNYLRSLGLSDNAIAQATSMIEQGATEQQVSQMLGAFNG